MPFKLNISIIDVCAFVPNDDHNPDAVRVVMPDARISSAMIDINDHVQVLPAHFPYLRFRLSDGHPTDLGQLGERLARVSHINEAGSAFIEYGIWFLGGDVSFGNLSGRLHLDNSFNSSLISSRELYPTAAEIDSSVLGTTPNQGNIRRVSARLRLTNGTFSLERYARHSGAGDRFKFNSRRGYLTNSIGQPVERPLATAIKVETEVGNDDDGLVVTTRPFGAANDDHKLRLKPGPGEALHVTFGNSPAEAEPLLHVPDSGACHTTLDFWLYSVLYRNPPGIPFFPEAPGHSHISQAGGCCVCKRFPNDPNA